MMRQNIMVGSMRQSKSPHFLEAGRKTERERERQKEEEEEEKKRKKKKKEEEKRLGFPYAFQGYTPNYRLSPAKPHLLKILQPPNSTFST
jgi:hypothetical protein